MESITVNMENLTEEERKQLLALVKRGNKPRSKVWKPEYGEGYYSCYGNGTIANLAWYDNDYEKGCYAIGNCFKTIEEAKFALEKRKIEVELKRFAEEHNDEEIDWNNIHQLKFYLWFDCGDSSIRAGSVYGLKTNITFFSSKEIAEQAIKEIGEERLKKYYFEVVE